MSKVRLYGDTSGFVDLKAPDVASNVTITLPNTTGPFATETYVDDEIAAIPAIAGIGSNVVQGETTTDFTTSSTSSVDWTGVTATITPSSATSKVLIFVSVPSTKMGNVGSSWYVLIDRGGTTLYEEVYIQQDVAYHPKSTNICFLDSPATTSPTVYKARVRVNSDSATYQSGSITAIEVAV